MDESETIAKARRLRSRCMDTIRDFPQGDCSFELDAVEVFDAFLIKCGADIHDDTAISPAIGTCHRCDGSGLMCPDDYETEEGCDYFDGDGPGPDDCANCGGHRSEHTPCHDCQARQ